jgi:hypothetical protein
LWLALGNLNNGLANTGLSCLNANNGLGNYWWNIGGRPSGKVLIQPLETAFVIAALHSALRRK